MTAPTSDERREVARRIRNNFDEQASWVIPWAVFNDADHHGDRETMERLADLIDPTCEMEAAGDVPALVKGSLETFFCSECGSPIYNDVNPSYCLYCGHRVVSDDE